VPLHLLYAGISISATLVCFAGDAETSAVDEQMNE
jgi:hypothetical protein